MWGFLLKAAQQIGSAQNQHANERTEDINQSIADDQAPQVQFGSGDGWMDDDQKLGMR